MIKEKNNRLAKLKKLKNTYKRKAMSYMSLFMCLIILFSTIPISAAGVLNIELSVDKSSVKSGETFTYTIKYANSSTTDAASNVKIIDELPSGVEYVSSTTTSDIKQVDVVGQTVTFVFNPTLDSGTTGVLKISGRFKQGVTYHNTTVTNKASIESTDITAKDSNSVNVTSTNNASDWTVTKVKVVPGTCDPALDQKVQYKIDVNSNSSIGGLNLKDIVVVDTLPPKAEFVSCSDSGVYSGTEDNQVTWSVDNLNVGSNKSLFVTVKYPTGLFAANDEVTNTVNATAKLYDDSNAPVKTDQSVHNIVAPNFDLGNITKNGRQSDDRYSVGQTARFEIGNIRNTGNVPIDKITIIDEIPSDITLTQVSLGKYSNLTQVKVSYERSEDIGQWHDWGATVDTPNDETLNVSDLGLDVDEYVKSVKWEITNVDGLAVGIANTKNIQVNGVIGAVGSGTEITNTAQLTASLDGFSDINKSVSKTITVIDEMPWAQPSKSVIGETSYEYDDIVKFNLRVQNHSFATGDYVNPRLIDLLPPEFENVQFDEVEGVDWINGNGGNITSVNYLSSSKEISGKTYSVLKWDCNGTLEPGAYVDIIFSAKIKNLTPIGYLTNEMYIGTQDDLVVLENDSEANSDTNDIDGDGNINDRFVKSQTKIFVKFQGSLNSEKWIRGELSTDSNGDLIPDEWNRHPDYSETLPGGVVDYKLIVENDGSNGPISNIVIIDILPRVGDTGVIDPSLRLSSWSPYLINKITGVDGAVLPAGVEVYYSTNASPSLEELNDTINNDGQSGDLWSLDPPEDITTVRALKFVLNGIVLDSGDSVSLQWPMRAPVGAPTDSVAWNSFAYGATYKDSNVIDGPLFDESFLPAEPIKVGHQIVDDPPSKYHLGNYVWEDMNKDGLQNDGETGINGILVNLLDNSDNSLIKYTRTGNNQEGEPGYYDFPNLPNGQYKVEFVYPTDYEVTSINVGGDVELDSNIDSTTVAGAVDNGPKKSVMTDTITINNANITGVDAGLYKLASLGDKVWKDEDTDGNQDGGESGIENVIVKLYKSVAKTDLQATTTTDVSGNYKFEDLDPGTYVVEFENPGSKYKFTTVDAGGINETSDSDATEDIGITTGTTAEITIESGENNVDVDAGMYLAQLGDFVWQDMDADGNKEAGDDGINEVTVKLFASNGTDAVTDAYGNTVNDIITSDGGKYLFKDLVEGDYVVQFVKPGSFDRYTLKDNGASDEVDSDGDTTNGKTDIVSLARGERNTTIDCGLYKLASLGNLVWIDSDNDGSQNDGVGNIVSDVTVDLLSDTDALISSTTTNGSGVYGFSNLEPDRYKVRFTNPEAKYKFATANAGGVNEANDSDTIEDAGGLTGTTGVVTLLSGQSNNDIDAGLRLAQLGDYVWDDKDADGIQDAGEVGIPNVTVKLFTDEELKTVVDAYGNNVNDVTTDADGYYMFDKLLAGDYVVQFIKPLNYDFISTKDSGANNSIDSDADTSTGKTDVVSLSKGERNTTIDCGMYKLANLGDLVWNDINGNGNQDAGENGIEDIDVELLNSAGDTIIKSTKTDSDGLYSFTNLFPGKYKVRFTKTSQYDRLSPVNAVGDSLDSDGLYATDSDNVALTAVINVYSGDDIKVVDMGMYNLGKLGDYVWEDSNIDGIQDAGEAGISNVTVKLNDLGDNTIMTTTTDVDGLYSFYKVPAGNYYIQFEVPALYDKVTVEGSGVDNSKDSNADSTGKTSNFTIALDEVNTTIDVGLYRYASLGNLVWEDENKNGIQEAEEEGITGVTVELYSSVGGLITSTVTDANGLYSFTNLTPGQYKVKVIKPVDYIVVDKEQGTDTSLDSNIDASGTMDLVTLVSGETNDTLDAGFYKKASVGDLVWKDLNNNGIKDANEDGISKVKITLYDSMDNELSSIETDDNGIYGFDDLEPASYTLKIVAPTGMYQTYEPDGIKNKNQIVVLGSGDNNLDMDFGFKVIPPVRNTEPTVGNYNDETHAEIPVFGVIIGEDIDKNKLYYEKNSEPQNGTVTISRDGAWTYTPNVDFLGTDSFKVIVDDYLGGTAISKVTINVVNDNPVTENYEKKTQMGIPVSGNIKGSDSDNDNLTYKINKESKNGEIVLTEDGAWTYTPNQEFVGEDSFNVTIRDDHGGETISNVKIIIDSILFELKGTITEIKTGKKIPQADLKIKDLSGKTIYTETTDNNGKYSIKDVELGNYIMEVTKLGYSGVSTAIIVKPDKAGDTVIIRDAELANVSINLVADPSTIVGDGKQTSILTTTIKDENNEPISNVLVVFSAGVGTFPNGNTSVTDIDGKTSVLFKSEKIEGVRTIEVPVKARVDDVKRNLHAEDQIIMTFEPASIQGIVVDNETGTPIAGAKIVVSKDFNNDGIVDFHSEMTTKADGKYKIAIPKGELDYNVDITKPFTIGDNVIYETFEQVTSAGEISGAEGEIFDANKTAAGLILNKQPDGSITQLDSYSSFSISVFEKDKLYDEEGEIKKDSIPVLDNINAESGTFIVPNLEKDKLYTFAVEYSFDSGKKIIVGKVDVEIDSEGEMNISSTLIDPYGDITDAVTGELIENAHVQLYYADTQRNIDAGLEPGTLVNLPLLEDFPPANNGNPQSSNENGKYAYMVFPTTDYYIEASKDGYDTYISDVISVEYEIVRHDFEMNPLEASMGEGSSNVDSGSEQSEDQSKEENQVDVLPKTGDIVDIRVLQGVFVLLVGLAFVLRRGIKPVNKN